MAKSKIKSRKPVKGKCKQGRPTVFSERLAKEICGRIAEGESLRDIAKDELMPSTSTICRWLLDKSKKSFWEQYAKSRNIQAELMFEDLISIADDGTNDWVEKNGGVIFNNEAVARSRLRVDTRKWHLSKVLPKKYGDKLDLTSNGKDLPIPIIDITPAKKKSDE